MSVPPENCPQIRPLYCELCDYIQFSSYPEFNQHHLRHIRQPRVSLSRLSPRLVEKINRGSYRVNTGVARKTYRSYQVPPIKLSTVVDQNGSKQFLVVRKQEIRESNSRRSSSESDCERWTIDLDIKMEKEEEMLQRLGSRVSVTRSRRMVTRGVSKPKSTNTKTKSTDDESDNEKKTYDGNKLLEMLLNGSDVSVETKANSPKVPKLVIREPYVKLERIEPHTSGVSPIKRPRIEENEGTSGLANNTTTPVKQTGEESSGGKMTNGNDSATVRTRKCPRTKYTSRGRRRQQSLEQDTTTKDSDAESRERVVDTAMRITEHRNSSAGSDMSADQVTNREESLTNTTDQAQMPSTSSDVPLHLDLSACVQTAPQAANNNANSGKETTAVSSTLISPNPKSQEVTISSFGNIPARSSESFAETTNFVAEADEVRESFCESLTSDGPEPRRGPQQPNEQAGFWASFQRTPTNNSNGNNQDAILVHNNQIPNGDAINANFLQNLLAEHQVQVQHGPIPADNSEFVSLERLAAQHQPSRFDMNNAEVSSPMEQLTQQVQRMSNPPSQLNLISHIQAPPPLHAAGVPLPQQRISSQPSATYDAMGHLQPSMGPPPLFQGFTVYSNQGFQQQNSTQQVIPRPPALQQCPQIQAGAYQNLAQAQPTRQKSRPIKRSIPGPPPPPELLMPKQRRSDPVIKGKSQPSASKGKAKAPVKPSTSGTRTPAKRTMDPQTVASVLAARGIIVTPSTSRQANVAQKPQQKTIQQKTTQQKAASSPVLNISSAITITPSSQNKNNGIKKTGNAAAAPVPRRNSAPIINNNVERPERCATVDLTDDEEPQMDLNIPGPSANRFVCNQCGLKFPTAASLESHKGSHRSVVSKSLRCQTCNVEFYSAEEFERHRGDVHKYRGRAPNWVIPVVDLDFPGAEDRLVENGITNFIPLSLDDDDGNYAIPIIQQDTPRHHRNLLGVSNVIMLGQIRSLFGPRNT